MFQFFTTFLHVRCSLGTLEPQKHDVAEVVQAVKFLPLSGCFVQCSGMVSEKVMEKLTMLKNSRKEYFQLQKHFP